MAEKAARAFDAAFACLRGADAEAGINFPDSPPAVARTNGPPGGVRGGGVACQPAVDPGTASRGTSTGRSSGGGAVVAASACARSWEL
ncbi:hypothetical protein E2562_029903 [Oryza meyeriana var. granulata]|uniref:AP2/ERF domain-containing protein n=1 Tax=Oryza meyeriana var. granulata TaxID=110450 RepID=A0A6G1CTL2_9ORYZ|nr:hypothetical protein E2562_029903 [Oryza meyeriana var. granulata]